MLNSSFNAIFPVLKNKKQNRDCTFNCYAFRCRNLLEALSQEEERQGARGAEDERAPPGGGGNTAPH